MCLKASTAVVFSDWGSQQFPSENDESYEPSPEKRMYTYINVCILNHSEPGYRKETEGKSLKKSRFSDLIIDPTPGDFIDKKY